MSTFSPSHRVHDVSELRGEAPAARRAGERAARFSSCALLLVLLFPGLCLGGEFEDRLQKGVADLASVDSATAMAAIDALIALPQTASQRRLTAQALGPLLDRDLKLGPRQARALEGALLVLSSLQREGSAALARGLSVRDPNLRLLTAKLLARRGVSALPVAFEQVRRAGWEQTEGVNWLLVSLGPPAFPPLVKALRTDPSVEVRLAALNCFGRYHEEMQSQCVWALENDPDPRVRRLAAKWITEHFRWSSRHVHPAVVTALERDPDPGVRRSIAGFLGDLGSPAEPALPRLFAEYRAAESDLDARFYQRAFTRIGDALRQRDRVRWWAVFEIYPAQTAALLLLLAAWYLLAPRALRRVRSKGARYAGTLVAVLVPAALAGGAVHYVLQRPWSGAFSPELVVDLPDTIVQAAAFVGGLIAWLRIRWGIEAPAPSPEPDSAGPESVRQGL